MTRLLWIVEDDYERRDPSNDGPAFYEFLQMLFSFDPWVKRAVADFHKRGGTEKPIDLEMLRADLQQGARDGYKAEFFANMNWPHELTPWRVAAGIDQLLRKGKAHEAAEFAQLYQNYASTSDSDQWIGIAGELSRATNAAQPK